MAPKATTKPYERGAPDMTQERTHITYAVSMGNPLVPSLPPRKFAYEVSIPYDELTPGTVIEDRVFTARILKTCRDLYRDELLTSADWKCIGGCGAGAKEIKFGYTVLMGPPKDMAAGMGGVGKGTLPLFADDAAVPFCGEEECFKKTKIGLEKIHAKDVLDLRLCAACGKGGESVKKCSRCKVVVYCSTECQTKSWREHKKMCSPP